MRSTFFEHRWPQGLGRSEGRTRLLKTKDFTYECAGCARQSSVIAGTIMDASKLPLTIWFWAAFLMATCQRRLGPAAAEPTRSGLLAHRLNVVRQAAPRHVRSPARAARRCGRGRRDDHPVPYQERPGCRARGPQRLGKMLVAGAIEIDGGKPQRARLKMIEGFGKQELHAFVLGAVAPQTQMVTDDWPSYQHLPGVRHNAITLGPMAAHIALP